VGSAVGVPYTGAISLPGYNSAKKSIVFSSTINNNRCCSIDVEEEIEKNRWVFSATGALKQDFISLYEHLFTLKLRKHFQCLRLQIFQEPLLSRNNFNNCFYWDSLCFSKQNAKHT
jgi:hypothetical protein